MMGTMMGAGDRFRVPLAGVAFAFCLLGVSATVGDVVTAAMRHPVRAAVSAPALPTTERGLEYFPAGHVAVATESLYDEIAILEDHPAVTRNILYFQTDISDRVQEWLNRFDRYRPLVEPIFAELGLPRELMYLSLVESGFNPKAYSRARASGPWQFIRSTGRMYGLKVNWHVDERRDPIKSTVAAARHLRDLYDQFGSWPLALAAYNAGAGKIGRAIRRSGTRDFWSIARSRRFIRRETRQYVPKFMALTMIAMNPARFGFHHVNAQKTVHQYEEIHLDKPVRLREVAQEAKIPFPELRRLNPELIRDIIPPNKDGYYLKVPVGMGRRVARAESRMEEWVQAPPRHHVRRGDSLSMIARRYGMSVRTLKRLNGLSGSLIRVGQRLRLSEDSPEGRGRVWWHRVRHGESLWSIARRYRVSVQALRTWNKLQSNMIRAGRRLRVVP